MALITGRALMPMAQAGGKLVRVPMGRGRFMLVTEQVAREKGYLPPVEEEKARAPARNKARKAAENK